MLHCFETEKHRGAAIVVGSPTEEDSQVDERLGAAQQHVSDRVPRECDQIFGAADERRDFPEQFPDTQPPWSSSFWGDSGRARSRSPPADARDAFSLDRGGPEEKWEEPERLKSPYSLSFPLNTTKTLHAQPSMDLQWTFTGPSMGLQWAFN
eukprot:4320112-Pyramimonas_sp.AAC.1